LLVALLASVTAITIFLYAREQAVTSSEVAGVDSTQASDVIFALVGDVLLLDSAMPLGMVGIGLIVVGLILFERRLNGNITLSPSRQSSALNSSLKKTTPITLMITIWHYNHG